KSTRTVPPSFRTRKGFARCVVGNRESGMARNKGTVGVIGLGIMGGAFAENLVAAGWRVVGYDIDAKRCRLLARAGVEIATDARDLAAEAAAIITSLPNPGALMQPVA